MSKLLFLVVSLLIEGALSFQTAPLYRSRTPPRRTATKRYSSSDSTAFVDDTCDVLVLGSGPAGRAVASLLGANRNLNVVLADQNADRQFPPNYGVWQDEWQTIIDKYKSMGVEINGGSCGQAVDRKWDVTDCFFGGSFDIPTEERTRIYRPYDRVDRLALRESLNSKTNNYRIIQANHISKAIAPNVYDENLVHDATGTTIRLRDSNGNLQTVRTKVVVDCTGHETKLVVRDSREPTNGPGFQIAYGCLVDVEYPEGDSIGPYDKEAMTLFDYRTDHYDDTNETMQQKVAKGPTFMYAMPLSDNRIFFEETSLVARPAISFQECKDRCMKRLEYHGIKITKLYEEEFCYIPMGGVLPAKDQRIIGLGGAATMVHPSTGYHLCRCLMGASNVANVILKELNDESNINLDRLSANAYHALWSPSNQRQRNFAVFGGEFLMKQNVVGLRGFFDGFFRLPLPLWAGFLAGWPGLPNNTNHETWQRRLWFGLNFVARLRPSVAFDMLLSIIGYIAFENLALAQSVTPFLGEPESYEYKPNRDNVGDVAAKMEARRMIQASQVPMDLPVDFENKKVSPTSPRNVDIDVAEDIEIQENEKVVEAVKVSS